MLPRIAIIAYAYGTIGGSERFVQEVTERLAATGKYEIHVFEFSFVGWYFFEFSNGSVVTRTKHTSVIIEHNQFELSAHTQQRSVFFVFCCVFQWQSNDSEGRYKTET